MYRAVTDNISVEVEPSYLPAHSDPDDRHWVWAYRITIANESRHLVQLRRRYWRIVDGEGRVEEVEGEGVVGEEPILEPGTSYTYSSGCPLGTPSGMMAGYYTMQRVDGSTFRVTIPGFSLDLPDSGRTLN